MYVFCKVCFTLGRPGSCYITAPVAYVTSETLEGNLGVFTSAFPPATPSQVWWARGDGQRVNIYLTCIITLKLSPEIPIFLSSFAV